MSDTGFCEIYNQEVQERYPLVMERIREIPGEDTVQEPFRDYFCKVAVYMNEMYQKEQSIAAGTFFTQSLEELEQWNQKIYQEILPEYYDHSYANPAYSVAQLGREHGQILSGLYARIRQMDGYAAENAVYEMTIYGELFVEIYNNYQEGTPDPEQIRQIIYWFYHDYSEIFVERSINRMVNPQDDFFQKILMESDLSDDRYLYRYGCYIGQTERDMAAFFQELPQEQIQAMADTYTEGYRIGFEVTRKDISKKKVVELYYPIGFERMVRAAVENFAKMGLKPVIRRGNGYVGVSAEAPNEQYLYDHKSDHALYLNKAYVERELECMSNTFQRMADLAGGYGGPAVIETFGKEPFTPQHKSESLELDEKQQELEVYFASRKSILTNQYIKGEERSFTIIAYPVTAIGPDFKEIFQKTIELNNLNYQKYQRIQQQLIDVLDQGEYVEIQGKGENRTKLQVALIPLKDPNTQTAFENCVADVNIPVGEVFTSPQLKGTNGVLHVSQVYLGQLKYLDLELTFQDGKIAACSCKNFPEEQENQQFLREHLLHHHATLPMGEFAIGTNTLAYRMSQDYQIADRLPILIAEKTGPHFAVGDTCYSHAEDTPVFNPDGKEIIARDNEVSLLRKEDPQNAYFNCHTDITIPFDELDSITVVTKEGTRLPVIARGRFVVPGTEELNEPLEAPSIREA